MRAIAAIQPAAMLKVSRVRTAASWASDKTPEKVRMPLVIATGAKAVLHQLLLSPLPCSFVYQRWRGDGDVLVGRVAIEIGPLVDRVGEDAEGGHGLPLGGSLGSRYPFRCQQSGDGPSAESVIDQQVEHAPNNGPLIFIGLQMGPSVLIPLDPPVAI